MEKTLILNLIVCEVQVKALEILWQRDILHGEYLVDLIHVVLIKLSILEVKLQPCQLLVHVETFKELAEEFVVREVLVFDF